MKKLIAVTLSAALAFVLTAPFAKAAGSVASIDLSKTALTHIPVDGTTTIAALGQDGAALTGGLSYASGNPAAASVDQQGTVTGLKPGIAVITVTADGTAPPVSKKIAVVVRGEGPLLTQGFETANADFWPNLNDTSPAKQALANPRSGNGSSMLGADINAALGGVSITPNYTYYINKAASANSAANREYAEISPKKDNAVIEAWFYDADLSKNLGESIKVAAIPNNDGQTIIQLDIGRAFYSVAKGAYFAPSYDTVGQTSVSTPRSLGWHQVVFDLSRANWGDNTGERAVYLDGELVHRDSYSFSANYRQIGGVFGQTSTDFSNVKLYFDDFNAYDIPIPQSNPAASEAVITKLGAELVGNYVFSDGSGRKEISEYAWYSSDSEDGIYALVPGAFAKTYLTTNEDAGKYFKFKVTPKTSQAAGTPVMSAAFGPVGLGVNYKIVGYVFGSQAVGASDASTLTHLNYAFAGISETGEVTLANSDSENLVKLSALKASSPKLKVLLSIGGGNAERGRYFADVASSPVLRRAFAESCLEIVDNYGLDGIDIDWEFPSGAADKANYTALTAKLREVLGADKTLTAATPASNAITNDIDLAAVSEYVDFFNVMTYDFSKTTHQSNLYPTAETITSVSQTVNIYLSLNVPRGKIVVGIPFYGRKGGETVTYKNLVNGYINKNGYSYSWDDTAKAPFLTKGDEFISYDDEASIAEKTAYIKENELGGAMFWNYGIDDGAGTLRNKVYSGLRLTPSSVTGISLAKSPSHIAAGETLSLDVRSQSGNLLTPANAELSFSTSNAAIAEVSADGTVTGVNPGIAVVTASIPNSTVAPAKLAVTVRSGSPLLAQGFETANADFWPNLNDESPAKQALANPRNGTGSSMIGKDINDVADGLIITPNYTYYINKTAAAAREYAEITPKADNAVIEAWFYDADTAKNSGASIRVERDPNNNAQTIIRMNLDDLNYSVANGAQFNPAFDAEGQISAKAPRSVGWHQAVFDLSRAKRGGNTGERSVYLDGNVIYRDSYSFADDGYLKIGGVFGMTTTAFANFKLYFDDFNTYSVIPAENPIPRAQNISASMSGISLNGSYDFADANGNGDLSEFKWYRSDSISGDYFPVTGADERNYEIKAGDIGKYFKFEVTPKTALATGSPIMSERGFGPVTGAAPSVSVPRIVSSNGLLGSADVMNAVYGEYAYAGILEEYESAYRWLSSPSLSPDGWNEEKIGTASASDYSLTRFKPDASLAGKYIKLEITPKNVYGISGETVSSDPVKVWSLNLPAVSDAYIRSDGSAAPAGSMFVKNYEADKRIPLMKFDLGTTGTNVSQSNIVKASLKFYVTNINDYAGDIALSAFPVTDAAWSESAVAWDSVRASVVDSFPLGSVTIPQGGSYSYYEIDITGYVKDSLLSGSSVPVAVWAAEQETEGNKYLQIRSKEADAGYTAVLEIMADGIAPAANALIADSAGAAVTSLANVAGQSVYAKITADTDKELALVFALYEGNELKGIAITEKRANEAGNVQAELALPPDTENYKAKAFMWDSINAMLPIGLSAEAE